MIIYIELLIDNLSYTDNTKNVSRQAINQTILGL